MQSVQQHKLLPTQRQAKTMQKWLNILRTHNNWMLIDRFDGWPFPRRSIHSCILVQGPIQIRDNPGRDRSQDEFAQLLHELYWDLDAYSSLLQGVAKQVQAAFDCDINDHSNGKRSSKPRFKGRNRFRTFTDPQIQSNCIWGNSIQLPRIGDVKIMLHHLFPEGSKITSSKKPAFYPSGTCLDDGTAFKSWVEGLTFE